MVDVGGGDEKVRVPRLPELKPPPIRASALVARKPTVAATTTRVMTARKTVRNMESSRAAMPRYEAEFDRDTDTSAILVCGRPMRRGVARCRRGLGSLRPP
jgi:hypothetical protein